MVEMDAERLEMLEEEVLHLKAMYVRMSQELDRIVMPADKSFQVKMVVREFAKGNKEPWKEMQRLNRIKHGIVRQKKGVRK